jgi:two-component system, OmpR family, KDP operon response regulator KdpE
MTASRILVVDDDSSIRKFIQPNFEVRGYQVLTALNGELAIQVAQKEKPDLIILDIMMPEMDGFEACRKIRECSSVPILMLSAREGENDLAECVVCGANDYLTKPFVLNELLSQVESLPKQT